MQIQPTNLTIFLAFFYSEFTFILGYRQKGLVKHRWYKQNPRNNQGKKVN